ncbi:hypothetical protein I7I50_09539 [Histoplasma capsulatum G186AR]|uniref:Uncharacterized protein n=1 Tax=Ajellomyces capsulatus TaxID=5037 RepID=A0A8H7YVJ8_AJECA|nr:hypothetical protein I7I52_07060 [Histoplasma capsulatum]QSS74397.1 hypothetical protein I7I50_09539 [Histoplasma capsulatum G186AR]
MRGLASGVFRDRIGEQRRRSFFISRMIHCILILFLGILRSLVRFWLSIYLFKHTHKYILIPWIYFFSFTFLTSIWFSNFCANGDYNRDF